MNKAERTKKSIFRERIAAKLIKSKDEVDLRMMRLHGILKGPPKTNMLSYLGVMTHLNRRFSQKIDPSSLFVSEPGLRSKQKFIERKSTESQKAADKDKSHVTSPTLIYLFSTSSRPSNSQQEKFRPTSKRGLKKVKDLLILTQKL